MARAKTIAQWLKLVSKARKSCAGATAAQMKAQEHQCLGFCCSTFANTTAEPHITQNHADLDNQIHPIFQRKKFLGDIEYKALEMPLRLASLLLESDALVPYINTMMHGDLQYAEGPKMGQSVKHRSELDRLERVGTHPGADRWGYWRTARHPKPGQDEVNDNTRVDAKLILAHLADMVEFAISDESSAASGSGVAIPISGQLDAKSAAEFPWGCKTRIEISKLLYEDMKNLAGWASDYSLWTEQDWETEYLPEHVLMSHFQGAVTLVHELGHALNNAALGASRSEPFYKDFAVSECGMQLETQLFGGMPSGNMNLGLHELGDSSSHWKHQTPFYIEKKRPRPFMCISEFPSHSLIQSYQHSQSSIDFRGKVPAFDVVWRTPTSFVEALFTKKFWDEEVAVRGPAALQPPRNLGWMFYSGRRGSLHPIVGANAVLSRAAQRAAIKWFYGGSRNPDRPDTPHEVAEDWSEVLDETAVVWQSIFDPRTRSQRKRENRKSAKASTVTK